LHLKRIHLHGFKSFAEPQSIELGLGLFVILGPNGAGKSNVADALRWALGETRSKDIRAARTEDFIFKGSQGRRALGMAEVSLTFEDPERRLGLPTSEVVVTRRAFRSGESEIRINDRPARLRDVTRLLLGTGLTSSGYAFIAQGQVESVLSEGPGRRRMMVEEAAGALVYRQRRTDALAELAHADEELRRAQDEITIEGERKEPLLKELARLEQQERLIGEIHELEVALEQRRLRDARRQVRQVEERIARETGEVGTLRAAIARAVALEPELRDARSLVDLTAYEIDDRIASVETQIARHAARRDSEGGRLAALSARRASLDEEERSLGERVQRLASEAAEVGKALADARLTVNRFRDSFGERPPSVDAMRLQAAREELEHQLEEKEREALQHGDEVRRLQRELASLREESQRVARERQSAQERVLRLRDEMRSLAIRKDRLEEGLAATFGTGRSLRPGPRAVLEAAAAGKLAGVVGPLGGLIRYDDVHAEAVSAALGSAFDNIVIEHERDVEAAIRHLRENRLGRATFLALDRVSPGPEPEGFPGEGAYLGRATDLVSFDPGISAAVRLVLGRTLVAQDLPSARDFSRRQGLRFRWVTLAGDLLSPGGAITGGESDRQGPGVRRDFQRVEARFAALTKDLEEAEASLAALADRSREVKLAEAEAEAGRDVASARLASAGTLVEGFREDLRTMTGLTPEDLLAWRQAIEDTVRLEERQKALAPQAREVSLRRGKVAEELAAVSAEIVEIGDTVESGGRREEDLEREAEGLRGARSLVRRLATLETTFERLFREWRQAAEGRASRREDSLERLDEDLRRIREELLANERRLTLELGAVEDPSASAPPSDAPERLSRLRGELGDLGPVNPGVREQVERSGERLRLLEERQRDALLAKDRLLRLAAEADEELERRYRSTFSEVNAHFARLFTELFEDGEGSLYMTGEGVEVRVAPPGKRPASLEALSGGERSLVAITFLLALSELNPTPFLLLDEVEAALDPENTRRFLRHLGRNRHRQFLVISHQRMTMEWADVLIGVTMETPGVSRFVEVRLEEGERGSLEAL